MVRAKSLITLSLRVKNQFPWTFTLSILAVVFCEYEVSISSVETLLSGSLDDYASSLACFALSPDPIRVLGIVQSRELLFF